MEKKCFVKKRGEPRSNGNPHNGNAAVNSTESAGTTEEVFAGMAFCQEINEVNSIGGAMYEEWLGDSGATSHITNNDFNMMNRKACEVSVTVSTGEVAVARVMGDIEMISEYQKESYERDGY